MLLYKLYEYKYYVNYSSEPDDGITRSFTPTTKCATACDFQHRLYIWFFCWVYIASTVFQLFCDALLFQVEEDTGCVFVSVIIYCLQVPNQQPSRTTDPRCSFVFLSKNKEICHNSDTIDFFFISFYYLYFNSMA